MDAAYLGSFDIEAEVFDESGYGGNLLGMSTSSIRLMVREDDFPAASSLLSMRANELVSDSQETPKEKQPSPPVDRLLSICLLIDGAILIYYLVVGDDVFPAHPAAVEDFLVSLVPSEWLWWMIYLWGPPLLAANLVANWLCFVRERWGRVLFGVCISLQILFVAITPQWVGGPWLTLLGTFSWVLSGFLMALLFFSPAAEAFVVRPDGESED